MKRYILVEGSIKTEEELELFKANVNDKIAEGYEPIGSPVIASDWMIQAMLLKKDAYIYSLQSTISEALTANKEERVPDPRPEPNPPDDDYKSS